MSDSPMNRKHTAPPNLLVHEALCAREDEVRHARVTSTLAARSGACAVVPQVALFTTRSPYDIAIENATEGCVRETCGARVATVQAKRAHDEAVARAMAVIAEDETRHAALA
jgi:hypothetical protein